MAPIYDCLTPAQLLAEATRIKELIGSEAHVSFGISDDHTADRTVSLGVYPSGIVGRGDYQYFYGATFASVIAQGEVYARSQNWNAAIIRKMALAIIDITDRLGGCSDTTLRNESFTADDILTFHVEACEAASRMAGNAPYTVTLSSAVRAA